MAGALGVQLQKPGAYALGRPSDRSRRSVIDDAAWMVWAAGGVAVAGAAGLAALRAQGSAVVSAPRAGVRLRVLRSRRRARTAGLLRRVARSVHGAVDPAALRAEGVDPAAIIDFSSNQSPLGAAPGVAAAVAGAVVDAYPDPHAAELRRAPRRAARRRPGPGGLRQRQHRAHPARRAARARPRRCGARACAGVRRVRGGHGAGRRAPREGHAGARRRGPRLLVRRAGAARGARARCAQALLALLAEQPDRVGAAGRPGRRPGRRAPAARCSSSTRRTATCSPSRSGSATRWPAATSSCCTR